MTERSRHAAFGGMIVQDREFIAGAPQATNHPDVTEAFRFISKKLVRIALLQSHPILDPLVVKGRPALKMFANAHDQLHAAFAVNVANKRLGEFVQSLRTRENFRADYNISVGFVRFLPNPDKKIRAILANHFGTAVLSEEVENEIVVRAVCPQSDFRVADNVARMIAKYVLDGARARLGRSDVKKEGSHDPRYLLRGPELAATVRRPQSAGRVFVSGPPPETSAHRA